MSCPTFWVSSTQFRKERTYLRAASPKTDAWCGTAFKAFQAAPGEGFSKRMQAFVVSLRERGSSHGPSTPTCSAARIASRRKPTICASVNRPHFFTPLGLT